LGGECGCSSNPDKCFVVETKHGERVMIAVWEQTCPYCDVPPLVMAGIISSEDWDDWAKDWQPEVYREPVMNADAFVTLDHVEKLEHTLEEAFEHLLWEHSHDKVECSDIFTKKGQPRVKWVKLQEELIPRF